MPPNEPAYAELQVTSNYSFLEGASHPHELATRAAALGHDAIAVTDRNTLAGIVRAHVGAREAGIRLVVGVLLDFTDHPPLLCYPGDRAAYGRLCQLLTLGQRRAEKGRCQLSITDFHGVAEGQIVALPVPPPPAPIVPDQAFATAVAALKHHLGDRLYLAVAHRFGGDDRARIAAAGALANTLALPLVATNDVLYHDPDRRVLQDVLRCIRLGCTIDEAGYRLAANAERHLKAPAEMARLFAPRPDAIARTIELAGRCRFSLDELSYDYPNEAPGDGRRPIDRLHDLTWEGAARRYPDGVPDKVGRQIAHELALIEELGYAAYFLTVHDIVRYARRRGILCQGRGSAANSAVCYCLDITAVDPAKLDLLFERFISADRREPPDIDVDFEHERREEVIQYVYAKYGRDHAALAASVSCYRARGALREVGKALGLSLDLVGKLAGSVWGWSVEAIGPERAREIGLDPEEPRLKLALALARAMIGFPRHLSQHVGGFVLTRAPLDTIVPIGNAAMEARTVIEWDKDDLDALKILKVDILALGMLTCLRKAFDLIARHHSRAYTLASVPAEDPATYAMLQRADSIGVFQVESRAQMTMLPRLKPRQFYDLVIEVAIVRPGPIQGDMVHPYLRRRDGREPVEFPSEELRAVLGKTLGVPLFQEQAMRIAIVAAGFTPAEADRLRRAMATFRRLGIIGEFRDKLIGGMVARGYEQGFAERCFKQIEGFGTYGFPESHAASFALLVYVSAFVKCHHPAAFAAALLNSQPMGFYAPAQIIRDAREHGVEVRPIDVERSDWDCTLEPGEGPAGPALRLGLRLVKGLPEAAGRRLVEARGDGFGTLQRLWRRAGLPVATLAKLAEADAFGGLGLDRRAASWAVRGLGDAPLPLFATLEDAATAEPAVALPRMLLGAEIIRDYATHGLSLKAHPLALLRPRFDRLAITPASELADLAHGRKVAVAGLVLVRQRPGSAKGIIFITLEDETGVANLILRPHVFEAHRRIALASALLGAEGRLERQGAVIHVLVERLVDHGAWLRRLSAPALDALRRTTARADEVRRPPRALDPPPGQDFRRMSRDFR